MEDVTTHNRSGWTGESLHFTSLDGGFDMLKTGLIPLLLGVQYSFQQGSSSETASASGPDLSTLDEVRPNFDGLSDDQWEKVRQLGMLLTEWNLMVNLISRKDIGNVMRNHVVPCLAVAKALDFEDGVEGDFSLLISAVRKHGGVHGSCLSSVVVL